MLTFASNDRIEEVRWLPSGNLIGLRQLTLEELFRSRPVQYPTHFKYATVVVWSFPSFQETILDQTMIPTSVEVNRPVEVGFGSDSVCVAGRGMGFLRLGKDVIQERFDFSEGIVVAVSPDGSRVLRQSSWGMSGQIELLETHFKSIKIDQTRRFTTRKIRLSPNDKSVFFYGPDNESIFRKRGKMASIHKLKIVPKEAASTDLLPDWFGFGASQFDAYRGDTSKIWKSVDGSLLIIKHKRLSIVHLDPEPSAVPLRGLGEPRSIEGVAVDSRNRFLVVAFRKSNVIQVFDLVSNSVIRQFQWGPEAVRSVDCSHDGTMIAAVAGQNKIIVWDVDF